MANNIYASIINTIKTERKMAELHYANYAKANDPNAVKATATLVASCPIDIPTNRGIVKLNSSIDIGSIRLSANQFADQRLNDSMTKSGYYETLTQNADATKKVTDDNQLLTMNGGIQQFLHACDDLSQDPGSTTLRQALIYAGQRISSRMNDAAQAYDKQNAYLVSQFNTMAGEINDLAARLANINITLGGNNTVGSTDLLSDQRNLIKELSQYGELNVMPLANNGVSISLGGFNLVGNHLYTPLPTVYNASAQTVTDSLGTYKINTGKIGALFQSMVINTNANTNLNTLTNAFSTAVNNSHVTGTNLLGNTNVKFFDNSVLGAAGLKVNSVIVADPKAIATSVSGDIGDNRLMIQIAQLKDTNIAALGNKTFQQYQSDVIFNLNSLTKNARSDYEYNIKAFESNMRQWSQGNKISKEEEGMEILKHVSSIKAQTMMLMSFIKTDEQLMQLVGRR